MITQNYVVPRVQPPRPLLLPAIAEPPVDARRMRGGAAGRVCVGCVWLWWSLLQPTPQPPPANKHIDAPSVCSMAMATRLRVGIYNSGMHEQCTVNVLLYSLRMCVIQ